MSAAPAPAGQCSRSGEGCWVRIQGSPRSWLPPGQGGKPELLPWGPSESCSVLLLALLWGWCPLYRRSEDLDAVLHRGRRAGLPSSCRSQWPWLAPECGSARLQPARWHGPSAVSRHRSSRLAPGTWAPAPYLLPGAGWGAEEGRGALPGSHCRAGGPGQMCMQQELGSGFLGIPSASPQHPLASPQHPRVCCAGTWPWARGPRRLPERGWEFSSSG